MGDVGDCGVCVEFDDVGVVVEYFLYYVGGFCEMR